MVREAKALKVSGSEPDASGAESPDGHGLAAQRLDLALLRQGLVGSRARARDLILRGHVRVDGVVCRKPARLVTAVSTVCVDGTRSGNVSRGAEKLGAALDAFGIEVSGRCAVDVGASTGGFTQVLLGRGAAQVYAVDVGTAQLHESLRSDQRVVVLEQTDARLLTRKMVPDPLDLVVADVSFVSLTKVLGPALDLTAANAHLVALIKPQFEVGPRAVGKGGVVRDLQARMAAVEAVVQWVAARDGWQVINVVPSPIAGGDGNQEYLIGASRNG